MLDDPPPTPDALTVASKAVVAARNQLAQLRARANADPAALERAQAAVREAGAAFKRAAERNVR